MPVTPEPADDDGLWRERLLDADPARGELESEEFAAAVRRLESVAQRCLNPVILAAAAEQQPAPNRLVARLSRSHLFSLLVAVAVILGIGLTIGRWWWSHPGARPEITAATEPSATGDESSEPQVDAPVADHPGPAPHEARPGGAPQPSGRGGRKFETVAELVKLPPSQMARIQRQLDRRALDQELQTWLRQWHDGSPDQRQALEQTWIAHRGFWASWTLQGLRTWTDPAVLMAGVEILSLELGGQAAQSLAFCWERAETRSLASVFLVPGATDAQLAQWLRQAEDREQVLRVLAEIVRRPSEAATDLLATLAVDPVCQSPLRDPSLVWHPRHGQRALAALAAPQPYQQYRAAMLLTVLDGQDIDQELMQKMLSGVQTLPAMAVWLLRHPGDSQQLATRLQHSPLALAVVPSASQRAQKWSRQQRSESSGPWSFRKVCQLCVTAS